MKGINKPFSKSLHAKNDPKSRKLIKEFFAERGVKLIDHPNKYDIDLITEDGNVRVEVERRLSWKSGKFPFASIHVLERKGKFFEGGNTHYCILSEDYKRIGFISGKILKEFINDKYLIEIPNRFVKKDEYAYDIPVEKFEFYDINYE